MCSSLLCCVPLISYSLYCVSCKRMDKTRGGQTLIGFNTHILLGSRPVLVSSRHLYTWAVSNPVSPNHITPNLINSKKSYCSSSLLFPFCSLTGRNMYCINLYRVVGKNITREEESESKLDNESSVSLPLLPIICVSMVVIDPLICQSVMWLPDFGVQLKRHHRVGDYA